MFFLVYTLINMAESMHPRYYNITTIHINVNKSTTYNRNKYKVKKTIPSSVLYEKILIHTESFLSLQCEHNLELEVKLYCLSTELQLFPK